MAQIEITWNTWVKVIYFLSGVFGAAWMGYYIANESHLVTIAVGGLILAAALVQWYRTFL